MSIGAGVGNTPVNLCACRRACIGSGHAELAWDILNRCTKMDGTLSVHPQEIFADYFRSPEVEMELELDAGSGVQAVVFGTFGLRPHADGSLSVAPSYRQELGTLG